jgi:polyketide cyclase/dehydrase/lipid transport protein
MKYEASRTTTAEPERLWSVLADVEKWPEWVEAYQEVRRNESGPLALGDTAYVKQHGLAGGEWTVNELEEDRVFAWETRQPGTRIVGRHLVGAEPGGGSRLTLQLEVSGWMSGVVWLLLGRKSRAYVDLECERLAAAAAEPTRA